jgi:hypothetical protein
MAPKKISRKDAKCAKVKTEEGIAAKRRKERKKKSQGWWGEAPERPQGVSREIDWIAGIR